MSTTKRPQYVQLELFPEFAESGTTRTQGGGATKLLTQ